MAGRDNRSALRFGFEHINYSNLCIWANSYLEEGAIIIHAPASIGANTRFALESQKTAKHIADFLSKQVLTEIV